PMSDWKGFCAAVLFFVAGAATGGAQDHQEKVRVTIAVAGIDGGRWILTGVKGVDGDAQLGAIVGGALKAGSFPSDWRTRDDFKLAVGDRWAWLADRLEKRGV